MASGGSLSAATPMQPGRSIGLQSRREATPFPDPPFARGRTFQPLSSSHRSKRCKRMGGAPEVSLTELGTVQFEVILNLTFGGLSRAIWFSRIRRWRFRKAGEATFGGPPQTNLSRLPEEMNWEERPFRSLSSKLIMTRSGNYRLAGRLYGKPFRAVRAV